MLSWYDAQLGSRIASQIGRYTGCVRISVANTRDRPATPVTSRVCAPKNHWMTSLRKARSFAGDARSR